MAELTPSKVDDEGDVGGGSVVHSIVQGNSQTQQQQPTQSRPSPQPQQCCCLVCYTDLRGKTAAAGITQCNHNEICGLCHLRLRHLHNDLKCPICKADNETVIVDYVYLTTTATAATTTTNNNNNNNNSNTKATTNGKLYEDYPMWGDDLGEDFIFDRNMFFPVDYYHNVVKPLSSYQCTVKDCGFTNNNNNISSNSNTATKGKENNNSGSTTTTSSALRALQDHLRLQHRLTLCQLCIDNKRDFVARLPRYSPAGLQKHQTEGPQGGHPVCEFCRPQRFYDVTALHHHLNLDHYKCHVCESAGRANQFFKNYRSLERHFDQQHYLCHDVQCLTARFMVFANDLDLRHHERSVHGGTASHSSGSTKIQLEFRVAGRNHSGRGDGSTYLPDAAPSVSDFNYALDGTAFVPAALPSTLEGSLLLHPPHVARTEELRLQAADLRQTTEEARAFPSLQESVAAADQSLTGNISNNNDIHSNNHNRLLVGWTSDDARQRVGRPKPAAGTVTEEDFPSLVSKKKSSTDAALAKLSLLHHKKQPSASSTVAANWSTTTSATNTATPMGLNLASRSTGTTNTGAATAMVDLSANSFPSLPSASSPAQPARYSAAQAFAKKSQIITQHPPTVQNYHLAADNFPSLVSGSSTNQSSNHHNNHQDLAADNFPALAGGNRTAHTIRTNTSGGNKYAAAEALGQKQAQQRAVAAAPPQWNNSATDFPSPPTAATTAVSVEDMKAALGALAYKQLKKFTREFATREMAADAYVDHVASLFPHGYADGYFWRFLPVLVSSCPPSADKDGANRYMDNLKRMRNGAMNAEAALASAQQQQQQAQAPPSQTSSGWSANKPSNLTAAPPLPRVTAANGPSGHRYVAPPSSTYTRGPAVATSSPSKNAWGSGIAPVVKAPRKLLAPTSVAGAAAAAAAAPNRSTATAYMAKEAKQENWQLANNSNNSTAKGEHSKKKNKQKNELRSLAFKS